MRLFFYPHVTIHCGHTLSFATHLPPPDRGESPECLDSESFPISHVALLQTPVKNPDWTFSCWWKTETRGYQAGYDVTNLSSALEYHPLYEIKSSQMAKFIVLTRDYLGFLGSTSGKEPICQCRRCKKHGFNPWVGKIPWRRIWKPISAFLPGESHGQRSLAGCSLWGCTESDRTEVTEHTHTRAY